LTKIVTLCSVLWIPQLNLRGKAKAQKLITFQFSCNPYLRPSQNPSFLDEVYGIIQIPLHPIFRRQMLSYLPKSIRIP